MPLRQPHDRRRGRRGRRGGHRWPPRSPTSWSAASCVANVDRALEEQPLDLRRRGPAPRPLPARRGGPTPFIQVIDAGDGVEVFGSEQGDAPDRGTRARGRGRLRAAVLQRRRGGRDARAGADRCRSAAGWRRSSAARSSPPTSCWRGCDSSSRSSARAASGWPSRWGGSPRATSSRRSCTSPRRRGTSPPPRTSGGGSRSRRRTRSASWPRTSTRCSTRWSAPSPPSASSWPTPRTSCARRSRRCARTSRCWPSPRRCRADERARLLADVEEQTRELGMLVADLIELARGDEPRREREDVRLDELVQRGASRAPAGTLRASGSSPCWSRRWSTARASGSRARSTTCSTTPPAIRRRAASSRCSRATRRRAGARPRRRHRARGPPAPVRSLLPRRVGARAAGLGLGLAIVRQVAEQHGGSVRAENAPAAAPSSSSSSLLSP